MRNRKNKTEHRGIIFTLIELLIVISIIALLAAMLLPALGNARKAAKGTKCGGTLKQIGMAYLFYYNDCNGWIPVSKSYGPGGGSWTENFSVFSPDYGYGILDGYWASPRYRNCYCPSDLREPGTYPYYGMASLYDSTDFCIKLEHFGKLHGNYYDSLSRRALLFDSVVESTGMQTYRVRPIGLGGELVYARHLGKANLLFTDFHVEAITRQAVPNDTKLFCYPHPFYAY